MIAGDFALANHTGTWAAVGCVIVIAVVAVIAVGRAAKRRHRQVSVPPDSPSGIADETTPTPAAEQDFAVNISASSLPNSSVLPASHPEKSCEPVPPSGGPTAPLLDSRRAWLRSGTEEHLLTDETARIGRSVDNDIQLADPEVSRHHALLHYERGGWWLLPEVTSNGTFCNGTLVQPGEEVRVRDGDELRFGMTTVLSFYVPPARLSLAFQAAARTTAGRRKENQDVHVATPVLLAVADGVAGRNAGRSAARTAIHTVATAESTLEMSTVLEQAHTAVIAGSHDRPMSIGMATTIDVVRLRDIEGMWQLEGGHVGDGCIFLLTGDAIRLLTRPDTVGGLLEQEQPERAARLRNDPEYDEIVAALGFDRPLRPHVWTCPAVPGQRLLLTSDGLVAALGIEGIVATLDDTRHHSAESAADALLELALDGPDNVTIVVADISTDSADFLQSLPDAAGSRRALDATSTGTGG